MICSSFLVSLFLEVDRRTEIRTDKQSFDLIKSKITSFCPRDKSINHVFLDIFTSYLQQAGAQAGAQTGMGGGGGGGIYTGGGGAQHG